MKTRRRRLTEKGLPQTQESTKTHKENKNEPFRQDVGVGGQDQASSSPVSQAPNLARTPTPTKGLSSRTLTDEPIREARLYGSPGGKTATHFPRCPSAREAIWTKAKYSPPSYQSGTSYDGISVGLTEQSVNHVKAFFVLTR
eukprot:TRINITY_DN21244_c0_g4_i1.p1 TRINITY_DN21244_c0_g4~~TRINITY_DN21244_c0_g4_i1.p1  ORF type:complete len:142 (+),score=0.93 TRINITY_DN21244_c0_g4_i1:41-466(+)